MERPKGNGKIIVRATPEMANWMHPQTDERKKLIQERVAAAKERFSQRNKHALKPTDTSSPRVEIQIGSIPVIVNKKLVTANKILNLKQTKKLPIHQDRKTKNR